MKMKTDKDELEQLRDAWQHYTQQVGSHLHDGGIAYRLPDYRQLQHREVAGNMGRYLLAACFLAFMLLARGSAAKTTEGNIDREQSYENVVSSVENSLLS